MMKDIVKHFNDDEDYCINEQTIGFKDIFRGVIVKEWIADNECCVNFLIKCCAQFHVEC